MYTDDLLTYAEPTGKII